MSPLDCSCWMTRNLRCKSAALALASGRARCDGIEYEESIAEEAPFVEKFGDCLKSFGLGVNAPLSKGCRGKAMLKVEALSGV